MADKGQWLELSDEDLKPYPHLKAELDKPSPDLTRIKYRSSGSRPQQGREGMKIENEDVIRQAKMGQDKK